MIEALPLSLSLAGLEPLSGEALDFRMRLATAVAAGYRAVQLDGAAGGMRARQLDRSARRDLASLLRRSALKFSGIDLWIPPSHFADPAKTDRAVAAVTEAVELAADLSCLVLGVGRGSGGREDVAVSVALPPDLPRLALEAMAARAETCGVRIADHTWPAPAAGAAGEAAAGDGAVGGAPEVGPIGVGLDPAVVLAAGGDPAKEASVLGAGRPGATSGFGRLASARLSDWSGSGRVEPGSQGGRLDMLAYAVALATAGYASSRSVVVDLRGVGAGAGAGARVRARWDAVLSPGSGV